MLVKDLMKQPLVIEKDISLSEAAKIMSSKDIGSLVFLSNGKITGIVTERDLMRNFGKSEKVSHAMSKKVITVNAEETLDRAAEIMRDNEIKRLPVVDDKEKLVGIITQTDLANHFEALEEDFFFE
jgi:CBS domain-containing protein